MQKDKVMKEIKSFEESFFKTLMDFKRQEFPNTSGFSFEGFANRIVNDFDQLKSNLNRMRKDG